MERFYRVLMYTYAECRNTYLQASVKKNKKKQCINQFKLNSNNSNCINVCQFFSHFTKIVFLSFWKILTALFFSGYSGTLTPFQKFV